MATTAPYIYIYGYKLMDRNMGLYGVISPLITDRIEWGRGQMV